MPGGRAKWMGLAIPLAALGGLFAACGSDAPAPSGALNPDSGLGGETITEDSGFTPEVLPDSATAPTTCSDGAPAPSGKIKCPSGINGSDYPKAGATCGPGSGPCIYVQPCGLDRWTCCGTWEKIPPDVPSCSLCPATLPAASSACPKENLLCVYPNSGGKFCEYTEAYCDKGTWSWAPHKCDPSCADKPPVSGDPCPVTAKDGFCTWAAPCHSEAYGYCNGSKWAVTIPCP